MTKSTQSAEEAYTDNHIAALDLLNQIEAKLFEMPAPESDAKIHWGHVGDLNEINSRLLSIIEFMTGEE